MAYFDSTHTSHAEKNEPRRATVTGFTKLGTFLNSQPIRSAARVRAASGEEFVLMPIHEYTVLTGIDADNLPLLSLFDTVSEESEDNSVIVENAAVETRQADILAHIPLEEEISVTALPL
ncbi:MAG: hypothetical protein AAB710_02650 [Patescibacteria group bacterium]